MIPSNSTAASNSMTENNSMSDTEVNAEQLADIDSYVEPIAEASEDIPEPERKDVEVVAGENAVGGDLLEQILEGALLAAGKPLTIVELGTLFEDHERPAGAAFARSACRHQ